jgi:GH24 family phage-related lysozyme (muramidase)
MYVSEKSLESIKQTVGFRARPYKDSLGNIIVGHNHVVTPGDGIAHKDVINSFKAHELLVNDIKQIVSSIGATNNMTQEEFDALVIAKYSNNGH